MQCRMREDDDRSGGKLGDRRERIDRIDRVRTVGSRQRHQSRADHDQRVTVGRGFGGELVADVARNARTVLDDDRLAGPSLSLTMRASASTVVPAGNDTMILTA